MATNVQRNDDGLRDGGRGLRGTGLNRGLSSRVWPVEGQEWVANGGGIAVDPTLPDW